MFNRFYQCKKSKVSRKWLILLVVLAIITMGIILIRLYNPYVADSRAIHMTCAFHAITGWYCSGCGLSRALYDLSRLDILNAIRNNALFVVMILPLLGYIVISELVNYLFEKMIFPRLRFNRYWVIAFVTIALIFTVVRNLPFLPWSYLAPL